MYRLRDPSLQNPHKPVRARSPDIQRLPVQFFANHNSDGNRPITMNVTYTNLAPPNPGGGATSGGLGQLLNQQFPGGFGNVADGMIESREMFGLLPPAQSNVGQTGGNQLADNPLGGNQFGGNQFWGNQFGGNRLGN